MKLPFLLAGIFGLAALVLASLIGLPLKGHELVCTAPFTQPMVALEFVASTEELQTLLGRAQLQENTIAVDAALGRDFLFILAYTFYLVAFAHAMFRERGKRRYLILAVLAGVIGLADILENGAITLLMDALKTGPAEVGSIYFQRLHWFTWTKWLGLVIYFAAAIPFLRRAGWVGQIIALAALVVSVLGILAVASRNWIQPYTTAVFLIFPLTVLFCFIHRAHKPTPTLAA